MLKLIWDFGNYKSWKKDTLIYSWPLNNVGVKDSDSHTVEYRGIPFDSPASLSISRRFVAGHWMIPKSADARAPYIKWDRIMYTISPQHPYIPNCV